MESSEGSSAHSDSPERRSLLAHVKDLPEEMGEDSEVDETDIVELGI